MAPRDIYNKVHHEPFEPFRLVTTDGKSFEVKHPEFCIVGLRKTIVFVPEENDPAFVDYQIDIDNLHIVRFEPLGSKAKKR